MNHYVLNTLLIFIYATNIFAIYFSRFQQHHLDLDTLINKIFGQKNYITHISLNEPKL